MWHLGVICRIYTAVHLKTLSKLPHSSVGTEVPSVPCSELGVSSRGRAVEQGSWQWSIPIQCYSDSGQNQDQLSLFLRKKPNQHPKGQGGEGLQQSGVLSPSQILVQWAHVSMFRRNPNLSPAEKAPSSRLEWISAFKTAAQGALHPLALQKADCPTHRVNCPCCKEPIVSPNISQRVKLLSSYISNFNT